VTNDKGARQGPSANTNISAAHGSSVGTGHPTASELLATPGAFLTRGHLRELGLGRRAVDSIFRSLPVVVLSGYSRPLVRVSDYLVLVADCTYSGDRVRS
jgi:hypothetical protein